MLIANIGLWMQRQIFDQDRFKQTAVDVMTTAKVRNAITDEIIVSILGDRPELKDLAEEFAAPVISDFLNSDIVEPAIDEIAGQIQVSLTSSEPKAVAIDISGITQPAKGVAALIPNLDPEVKTAIRELPNSIELIEKGTIPSIYTPGIIFLWLGRVGGVAALVIVAGLIWAAIVNKRSQILKILGTSISVGAVIFLVLIWSFRAPIIGSVGSGNIQVIIGSIYEAFINILVGQTSAILVGGLIVIAGGYLLDFWHGRNAEEETSEKMAA